MENQPTVILLLFTDYLNNRDSIALFRLSRSFWLSHRSPAGRYFLKPLENGKFLRPPNIPAAVDFPLSGHFLLPHLRIEDFDDFSQFVRLQENSAFRAKQLSVQAPLVAKILQSAGRQLPDFVDTVFVEGNCRPSQSFKDLREILPTNLKALDFTGAFDIEVFDDGATLDFSSFPHLSSLILWLTFDSPLSTVIFPPTLHSLVLGGSFSQEISEGILPENLEFLSIGGDYSSFNTPLPQKMPRNLKRLEIGESFNHPISPGWLPEGLKIFKLSSELFNHSLEFSIFPQGIEEIVFRFNSFDRPWLPGIFPNSLKYLDLRISHYSQPILPGVLPESLERLIIFLGSRYSQAAPLLPPGLKSLTIDDSFKFSDSPNLFPPQLKSITFGLYFRHPLPPQLSISSIQEISLGDFFNERLTLGKFPIGLKIIRFGCAFNQMLPVGIFPEGIHTIELGDCFSQKLEVGLFPSSVRKLTINTAHPLPVGLFPEGLEAIKFSSEFNQLLVPGIFPSSLRSLKFTKFPDSRYSKFSQDLRKGILPQFLCELELGPDYMNYCPASAIPPYFLPDCSSSSSNVPRRLKAKVSNSSSNSVRFAMDYLQNLSSRLLRNRQYLLKSFRAPVSSRDYYFLAEPLDGVGESFLVHKEFILPTRIGEGKRCTLQ